MFEHDDFIRLRRRIERVEGLEDVTPGRGIEVAKALFAERFSDKIMAERGVKVVSVFETAKLKDAKGIKIELPAKIDTGAFRSSIDRELAESLGLMKNRAVLWHDYYVSSLGREKRPVIPVTFWLIGRKIETTANVSDRSKMKEKFEGTTFVPILGTKGKFEIVVKLDSTEGLLPGLLGEVII